MISNNDSGAGQSDSKRNNSIPVIAAFSDPRLFIRAWIQSHGVTIQSGGVIKIGGERRERSSIFGSMWLDYTTQFAALKATLPKNQYMPKYTRDDLREALEEFISEEWLRRVESMRQRIACREESLDSMREFAKALAGHENETDLYVLAHWLWQIKRKIFGKEVFDHIMPVLYGPQGTGKSTAVTKLLKPIADWRADINLQQLDDDRYAYLFKEHFVIVFDEMQYASKSNIDSLKNKITTNFLSTRRLHTNMIDRVIQNCSFIGTTNRPLDEQIYDPTGMRRFYPLNVGDSIDWQTINAIDYECLLKGIDENRPNGYLDNVRDALLAVQAQLVAPDHIEDFIEEHHVRAELASSFQVPAGFIYTAYKAWALENGYKPLGAAQLGKQLKNRGVRPGERASIMGKQSRTYIVSHECFVKYQVAQASDSEFQRMASVGMKGRL